MENHSSENVSDFAHRPQSEDAPRCSQKPYLQTACVAAISIMVCVVLVPALLFLCLLIKWERDKSTNALKKPVSILHSTRPYNAVEVPFVNHAGHIVVQATLAGKSMDCLVDTGCRDIIWQNMDIPYQSCNQRFQYSHFRGLSIPAEVVSLSSIRLGDYELPNVRTTHLPGKLQPLIWTLDDQPLQVILGNAAFENTVMTIDYQRSVLILRSPNYDITHLPRHSGDCLLKLTPGGDDIVYSPEYLTADGSLDGCPVHFVMDTGHSAGGILATPEIRKRLKSVQYSISGQTDYFMQGAQVTEVTSPLPWSLGTVKGTCRGMTIKLRPEWQAVMGYEVLKNFRVTIDYPRNLLLLEPYPHTNYLTSGNGNAITARPPLPTRIPPGYSLYVHPDGSWELKLSR